MCTVSIAASTAMGAAVPLELVYRSRKSLLSLNMHGQKYSGRGVSPNHLPFHIILAMIPNNVIIYWQWHCDVEWLFKHSLAHSKTFPPSACSMQKTGNVHISTFAFSHSVPSTVKGQQLLSSVMVQHCGLLPLDRVVVLPCMLCYSQFLLHPPPTGILVFFAGADPEVKEGGAHIE